MGRHFEAMPRDGLGVVLPSVLPSPLGIRGGLGPNIVPAFDAFELIQSPWVATPTQVSIDGTQTSDKFFRDTNPDVINNVNYFVQITALGASGPPVRFFIGDSQANGYIDIKNGEQSKIVTSYSSGKYIYIRAYVNSVVTITHLSVRRCL